MNKLTYENQGSETMLVYHLGAEEHMDHFAKGMLQENEMEGILRPAFIQRDMEQYLKYPVTSKLPLKDFLTGEIERETVLKLCLSITGAIEELEEYMLSPEKLILDEDYIFVDVRKKCASLVYLPIDECSQEVSVKNFLRRLLSHMRFRLDQDVTYVAKLFHFLNQPKGWEHEELKRYIENLIAEKSDGWKQPAAYQESGRNQSLFSGTGEQNAKSAQPALQPPGYAGNQVSQPPVFGGNQMPHPPVLGGNQMPHPPVFKSNQPSQPPARTGNQPPQPPTHAGNQPPAFGGSQPSVMPLQPPAEDKQAGKQKAGLFGKKGKEEKKSKNEGKKGGLFGKKTEPAAPAVLGTPAVPGISAVSGAPAVPGIPAVLGTPAVPGTPVTPGTPVIPGTPAVAHVSVTEPEKKKKGLFGHGKKKEKREPVTPVVPVKATGMPPVPGVSPAPGALPVSGTLPVPGVLPASGVLPAPGSPSVPKPFVPEDMNHQQDMPSFQSASTVYVEQGSSDEDNRTVIMGGGDEQGSTVLLGAAAGAENTGNIRQNQIVKMIRRRTGQSMVIHQDSLRIGSEGSFVDFYIADNPAIGGCHADISRKNGICYITDRNSANHSYVNGRMIPSMQAVPLENGAVITLADEDFDFIIS